MASDVATNNGPVPELQRKARQRRVAEAAGMQGAPPEDSSFLMKNGSLLPAIAVPTVNSSAEGSAWKQQAGPGLPAMPSLGGMAMSSASVLGELSQVSKGPIPSVKSGGMMKWTNQQSFLGEMDLERREKELALMRDNQQEANKLLLESWLNEVLDSGPRNGVGRTQTSKGTLGATKHGLTSYGLSRAELASMGLVGEQIDRLYRSLYVYTIGFHDSLRSMFKHCNNPTKLLTDVWKGYISVADAAIQVGFKSEFLSLVSSKTRNESQLLMAEEALAVARQDQAELQKSNTWLTGAHTEERAMRQVLETQVAGAVAEMEREKAQATSLRQKCHEETLKARQFQDECQFAKDQADRVAESLKVTEVELAETRATVQKLEADMHNAYRTAKEAEMLEAQARRQHEMDMIRIADLNQRLTESWKEVDKLRAEMQEEIHNRKHIMDDIRVKQQAIAEQEEIITNYVKFQHQYEKEMLEAREKIEEVEKIKEGIDAERAEAESMIENLKCEKEVLEERLATKRMKKRTYKTNLNQLREEYEDVKKAYARHDQDRERDREHLHDVENALTDKKQECASKEAALYLLNKGLSSVTPVIWKLEKAIAWYRKELPSTRDEVQRLNGVVAQQVETIQKREDTIADLRRYNRHVESERDRAQNQTGELELELQDVKKALTDEKASHNMATHRFHSEKDKLETALKASRKAQEKLKNELAHTKGEVAAAQRRVANIEGDMEKLMEEHKDWRTIKMQLETQIQKANEAKLEVDKQLIKANSEAQNFQQEFHNAKKLLTMTQQAQEEDSKAADTNQRQLTKAKEDLELMADFLAAMVEKFQGLATNLDEDELNGVKQVIPLKEDFGTLFTHIQVHQNRDAKTIEKLRADKSNLEQTIAMLKSESAEMEKAMAGAKEEMRAEMQAEIDEVNAKKKAVEVDLQGVKDALQNEVEEKERYISKVEEKELNIKALELDIAQLNKEKQELQARISVLTTKHQEALEELNRQKADLETELKQEKQAHAETASKLGNTKETVAARNISITQMKLRIRKMETQVKDLTTQLRNAVSVRNYLQAEQGRLQEAKVNANKAVRQLTELADQQKAELQSMHILMNNPTIDGQAESFQAALKEKADEIIDVTVRLNRQIDAKDQEIANVGEQLLNTTNELEEAQESLKLNKKILEDTKEMLREVNHNVEAKVDKVRQALLEDMRQREEKLQNELAKLRRLKEKEAAQYARETAERDFNSSLATSELTTVPFIRSSNAVIPVNRTVRNMVATEMLLKQTLSEAVFAASGPALSIRNLEFRTTTLLVLIGEITLNKSQQDLELLQAQRMGARLDEETQTMEEFTYDHFLRYLGVKPVVEAHLHRFVNAILANRFSHKRINMFGRLLGLYNPLPEDGVRFFLNARSALHEGDAGFRYEHNEGTANVTARTILAAATDLFKGCKGEKASKLPKMVLKHANDDIECLIDLDMVLEWFIDAWEDEMTGIESRVVLAFQEMLTKASTTESEMDFNDFKAALESAVDVKDQKVAKGVFRDLDTYVVQGHELTEFAILDALQANKLLGVKGVNMLPQKVLQLTVYDAFLLLEDSWKGMFPEIELQLPQLEASPEHEAEAKELREAIKKLEYMLQMRVQVDLQNAWKLFRRLVSAFVIHQTRMDFNDIVQKLSTSETRPLEKTRLPVSQNRRVMYGLNPIKQRTIETAQEQNRERLEQRAALGD